MNISQSPQNMRLPFRKTQKVSHDNHEPPIGAKPLPAVHWMPDTIRNHFVAMIGEFVGTFMFLFFAFSGTQVSALATSGKSSDTSSLLYICLAFGFSLSVNVWVFFRITGGMFNPAVTLALCLTHAVGWVRGLVVGIAQVLGAIAAAAVVSGLFPGPLNVLTTLQPGTSIVQGLFIEMFLTAELIFTIFMLAAEKHKATFLAPIGIGLALFIAELSGVFFTGGSLNPARSFGPAVVSGDFASYHWIYWLGPFLGAAVAVLFYTLVKGLEYETVNPGQDSSSKPGEVYEYPSHPLGASVPSPHNGPGYRSHEHVARPDLVAGRKERSAV